MSNETQTNKIPKIIHYCWLSNDPNPQSILDCIESWKKTMPDYEIMCWDSKRFDTNSVPFVRDACKAKKWATATDYIRLHALLQYGGIYMDSDVMTYKSFDPFLKHSAFSSIEFWPDLFYRNIKKGSYGGLGIEAAVIGAEPNHPWIRACIEPYADIQFEHTEEFMNFIIMSGRMAEISAQKFGFKYHPVYQVLDNDVHLYPPDVFSRRSENSIIKYSTHFCANSWRDPIKPRVGLKNTIKDKIVGVNNWNKVRSILGMGK